MNEWMNEWRNEWMNVILGGVHSKWAIFLHFYIPRLQND